MPNVSTGTKITKRNLDKHLRCGAGVPVPRMGNIKGLSKEALAEVYRLHLAGEVKYKTDTQGRIKAYAKDYVPKRGRPATATDATDEAVEAAE